MYPRLEVWKRSDVRQLESSHLDVVFFGSLVDTALQRLSSFDVARAAVREVEEVGSVLARVEEFSWAQMAAEPKLDSEIEFWRPGHAEWKFETVEAIEIPVRSGTVAAYSFACGQLPR